MDKKKLITIIIGAVLLFSIIVGIGVSRHQSPYEHQISLAYKYLEEGNYQEAIIAFNKAIEIAPEKYEAYLALSDTYVTMGDFESAKKILERGIEATGSKKLKDALSKLSSDKGIEQELSNDILRELMTYFENKDYENVKKKLKTVECRKFVESLDSRNGYILVSADRENTGIGVGLYANLTDAESGLYIGQPIAYYGNYVLGERQGDGMWITANDDSSFVYQGQWENDYPNGAGTVTADYGTNSVKATCNYLSGFPTGVTKIVLNNADETITFEKVSFDSTGNFFAEGKSTDGTTQHYTGNALKQFYVFGAI